MEPYKSRGESKIASLLDSYKIPFLYEKETLLEDDFKLKIWYPNFYLPDFKVYVEYFGIMNNLGYSAMTDHKIQVFRENKLDLVSVFPEQFNQLENQILGRIDQILTTRATEFRRKIESRSAPLAAHITSEPPQN